MVDVFISYKREERARCERIVSKLRALALDVWFDAQLEPGRSFDREIEATVNNAKVVLVLWSPASVDSQWVRNEATVGQKRGVLAAAQVAPCNLPINFTNTHFEELEDDNFPDDHPGWLKLLTRIGTLTGRPGLADYSRAIATATAPLRDWAKAHPSDPLSRRIPSLMQLGDTGGHSTVKAAKPKASPAAVLIAGVAALVAGFGVAWVLKPVALASPESIAPEGTDLAGQIASANAVPVAKTSVEIAASLVGTFGPSAPNSPPDCATAARLEIALVSGGLSVGSQVESIVSNNGSNEITTRGADGMAYAYSITADVLTIRLPENADVLEYRRCV